MTTDPLIPPRTNVVIAAIALSVFLADQLTKGIVIHTLGYGGERIVIDGFFRFVHWGNTGAAWSLFTGHNRILTLVSLAAFAGLILARRHFEIHTTLGRVALGLILGGILGNVTDRLLPSRGHVIDFLYFYTVKRSGMEIGFPAFNVADSAICFGVGFLFLLSFRKEGKNNE